MTDSKLNSEEPQLDWIQLKKDIGSQYLNNEETTREKMARKLKENPLVPIGCLATASALLYGLWCFRLGRGKMAQYMMRARVAAQGFTVVALIIGIGITATKQAPQTEKNSKQ